MKKFKMSLLACLSFALGMTIGIIVSPVKGGFGNNTGNTSTTNYYIIDKVDQEKTVKK